jgi:galactose mutarotase-like enzyme
MPVVPLRTNPTSPTGQQWVIGHGHQQAVITEVGATLRAYTMGDRAVVDGFGPDQWSHDGRGQVLAPWPNRLADGRYEFAGIVSQAPVNEADRGNALHGMVRWLPWQVDARSQNVVSMSCRVFPTPGYPFGLLLRVEYRLGREGLVVSTTAANVGAVTLPFGLGFHPYVTVGTDVVDTAVLRLPATERLVLDDRALPTGDRRSVAGTEHDFTGGRSIGPTRLDTAFGGLVRDGGGIAWATLTHPDGEPAVGVWMDEGFAYLMCYTGDSLGDVGRRRQGVAVEPMTCPPNAFRTGDHLITLEPGQAWEGAWGIHPG